MIFLIASACSNGEETHNDTYTCPMHPTVISDRPGSCPVCGMDLVRKARAGEELKITEELSRLMKSPDEVVVASVKTIKGEYKAVPVAVEAPGIVTYDTRNIYTIPARVGGRLEKVWVKYNYQSVRKGEKVAEIYSPELLTAQRELLFLLENDPENGALLSGAKSKLALLGLTPFQIDHLAKSRRPQSTFAIYSPYSGYVITGDSAAPTITSAGSTVSDMRGMEGASSATSQRQNAKSSSGAGASIVREGSYVIAGETLFRIVDANALRIELDWSGAEKSAVKVGDTLTLITREGQERVATIDFVQPFFNEGENFSKLRVYTNDTEGLQIGQLIKASIRMTRKESLWVPRSAVMDLGTQKVVFIKDKEALRPKKVVTGVVSDGLVEITGGLASGDEIAATAHYLIDSESFIKPVN